MVREAGFVCDSPEGFKVNASEHGEEYAHFASLKAPEHCQRSAEISGVAAKKLPAVGACKSVKLKFGNRITSAVVERSEAGFEIRTGERLYSDLFHVLQAVPFGIKPPDPCKVRFAVLMLLPIQRSPTSADFRKNEVRWDPW